MGWDGMVVSGLRSYFSFSVPFSLPFFTMTRDAEREHGGTEGRGGMMDVLLTIMNNDNNHEISILSSKTTPRKHNALPPLFKEKVSCFLFLLSFKALY